MALEKCPQCGNEVSTTAAACPKCGRLRLPAASGIAVAPAPGAPAAAKPMSGCTIALIVCGCLGLFGLVVVGILAAVAVPKLTSAIDKAKVGAASGDIGAFNSALALYQADVTDKTFPTRLTQLLSDNTPGWSGPYMATISPDPWNNAYTYTGSAGNYTLQSVHDAPGQSATIRYVFEEGRLVTLP